MGRLGLLPPYLFSEIDAARGRAEAAGRDVIDLGVGDPDRPTPEPLLQAMTAALADPRHHRYPPNPGLPRLKRAIADWLQQRHAVHVDPDHEVLVLVGSKEGLAHLPLALLEEGDEVLCPDPGYPVYQQATVLAGGKPVLFPLRDDHDFEVSCKDLEARVGEHTRLLYLNYPNNPTGATISKDTLHRVLELTHGSEIVLANDAAYIEVAFGPKPPVSLLAVADHRRHRVLEFHSFSKMFNMTGWRLGFAAGHADLIRDLGRVKQSIDSGAFGAIQQAVAGALTSAGRDLLAEVLKVYPGRRASMVAALENMGCEVFSTDATFYVWARVPGGEGSLAFCSRVLQECDVVLTPGVGFGLGGEGWFRASLTAPDQRIETAASRLRRL